MMSSFVFFVGTRDNRTNVRGKDTADIPTVTKKDTGMGSKVTGGRGSGDRRAACSPAPEPAMTYASALRGTRHADRRVKWSPLVSP
jgi:hypothetical protein